MISYENFDLRIQADGSRFVVCARLGSQAATEPLALDLSRDWDLWDLETRGAAEIKDRGIVLFEGLIRGTIRDLYQQGRGAASHDAARGLRIRVLTDPADEHLRPFLAIPWEILFDPRTTTGAIAFDPQRAVVRIVDSIDPAMAVADGKIERVLIATATPSDYIHLDVSDECSEVEGLLARNLVRPRVCRQATREKLFDCIRSDEPQVVHFMGHGKLDDAHGQGVLLLENEKGEADPLNASTLASFFAGQRAPQLIVLTACLTAVPGRIRNFGPFSSVAAALIAAGVPMVIAMQSKIRDASALRFTERLYRGVLRGEAIEKTVAEARGAIRAYDKHSLDWATPVLFMRAGELKPLNSSMDELLPPPAPPPTSGLSMIHHGDGGFQIFGPVTVTQKWEKSS